jgi:ectoine hydroxylase-related dioxygenase (phytanoyl-CoA dioxygenase family)
VKPILHPRNVGFEWENHVGPYRRLRPEQARAYDERGFIVLEDVFDADTVGSLIAEIDPLETEVETFLRTRRDGRLFIARADEITFTTNLVLRSSLLRAFCGGAFFRDLAHDLVGPDVRLYWDQAVYKKPGTEAPFPWHQDNGYTYLEPQQYLTCWVALTDASVENGCPWVIPGLHRSGTLLHRPTELGFVCLEGAEGRAVPAPVRAGGVVVFSSLTPHATGPNRTSCVRKAYIVQLAPDGAVVFPRNARGEEDPAVSPVPANDPQRQFPILVGRAAPATRPRAGRARTRGSDSPD